MSYYKPVGGGGGGIVSGLFQLSGTSVAASGAIPEPLFVGTLNAGIINVSGNELVSGNFVAQSGRFTQLTVGSTNVLTAFQASGIYPTSGLFMLSGVSMGGGSGGTTLVGGIANFSGNGSGTTFLITHSIGNTPAKFGVAPNTADAMGDYRVEASGNTLSVVYTTARASGTGNVGLAWFADTSNQSGSILTTIVATEPFNVGTLNVSGTSTFSGALIAQSGNFQNLSVLGNTQLSGNLNAQSGIFERLGLQQTLVFQSGMSGISFSGMQLLPARQGASYVIWTSGTNGPFCAFNTNTGVIEFSGGSGAARAVIQSAIDAVTAGGTIGGTVQLKTGLYSLQVSGLYISGLGLILQGDNITNCQIRASGAFPAIAFKPKTNQCQVRDLIITHNNADTTIVSGVNLVQFESDSTANPCKDNRLSNVLLYDFGKYTENAIGIINQSGTIYRINFDSCVVTGFENAFRIENPGSGTARTIFIQDIKAERMFANGSRRFLSLKNGVAGEVASMHVYDCGYQYTSGAICAFDYETENSGISQYNKHIGNMFWDLPAAMPYAVVNSGTELELHGCIPSYKISGAGMLANPRTVSRWDRWVTKQGQFVGSGNASTTVYTFIHALAGAPTFVTANAASPQARGDFDVSGGTTQITVTYPIAPASGTILLNWSAQV